MQIVYAGEETPGMFAKSLFLAGPTARDASGLNWRTEALNILQSLEYTGVVFVPEPRDGKWQPEYDAQIEWEEKCLNMADCIAFWVPRELTTMPAYTTNIEWGVWQNSGKVVFGAPIDAPKTAYLRYYAKKLEIKTAENLEDTLRLAVTKIGNGSMRQDGECEVPLLVWQTPHFQSWYKAQRQAGNKLNGARVVWTFRVGANRQIVFFWALQVDMYIASEKRHKTNEVVISRPDISAVLLYNRSATAHESRIVLVREFRSPSSTEDGYVWELPGGSSPNEDHDPLQIAADECFEEVGLTISPERIRQHEVRQLCATMSAHKAHLFSAALTNDEIDKLIADFGTVHGNEEDTERTYVHVVEVGDLLDHSKFDWSTLGMVLSIIFDGHQEVTTNDEGKP